MSMPWTEGCEKVGFTGRLRIAWPRSAIIVYDRLFRTRSFAELTVRRYGLQWLEPLSKPEMESLVSTVQKAYKELLLMGFREI